MKINAYIIFVKSYLKSILWQLWMKIGNTNKLFLTHLLQSLRNSKIVQEFIQSPSSGFVVILLDKMTYTMDNNQFEFSLHLSNRELFI